MHIQQAIPCSAAAAGTYSGEIGGAAGHAANQGIPTS